jgi:hypothetical protein
MLRLENNIWCLLSGIMQAHQAASSPAHLTTSPLALLLLSKVA